MSSPQVQTLTKEVRSVFSKYEVFKLNNSSELINYDYALTFSIDTYRNTISMSFRDVLINQALVGHTISYGSYGTALSATRFLALELKNRMDQKNIKACN